jgi:hypothetical protein
MALVVLLIVDEQDRFICMSGLIWYPRVPPIPGLFKLLPLKVSMVALPPVWQKEDLSIPFFPNSRLRKLNSLGYFPVTFP